MEYPSLTSIFLLEFQRHEGTYMYIHGATLLKSSASAIRYQAVSLASASEIKLLNHITVPLTTAAAADAQHVV